MLPWRWLQVTPLWIIALDDDFNSFLILLHYSPAQNDCRFLTSFMGCNILVTTFLVAGKSLSWTRKKWFSMKSLLWLVSWILFTNVLNDKKSRLFYTESSDRLPLLPDGTWWGADIWNIPLIWDDSPVYTFASTSGIAGTNLQSFIGSI